MKIVREAPKRKETMEEILAKIKEVINQIKDYNKKRSLLEKQRSELSDEVQREICEIDGREVVAFEVYDDESGTIPHKTRKRDREDEDRG